MEANKQHEVLKWASLFLEENGREQHVAVILLKHYLQVSTAKFYMNMQEPVPEKVLSKYVAAIKEHATTGMPAQHLMGYAPFYGREYKVNEHVLIPRPETEELVQQVITAVNDVDKSPTIVDIGTGSGIIAITLALELPNAIVYATDISEEALTVAKENAVYHQAAVKFATGDFLEPILQRNVQADVIVSNPPYIAISEAPFMADTVKHFDPKLALFADRNGLAAYEKIISQMAQLPKMPRLTVFEIGYQQGKSVSDLIKAVYPDSHPQVLQDMNGKDRMVIIKK
ncbi:MULTISPECIES: peptide chain release factor N(5)-glutamine methyltransferase [Clostridia]|uniref:peptide chain release factor N(5)-glutamine methyltransferase n=1 Tax=Clostridia TaxID=186801 RepID=UPI000EA244CF|nr:MULTISPECIES: peptide chain release factor N(5)-glutamine methyltransferase [Clostridia]NBJ69687.1 peptide chain release factor N(5)-glutamine methyltransferase [Roseburia sp. 1XD42-34]RKI78053.1 peptide chain release factor N(5)-glutamine methyltransferase [Clostridium sp. 1xD42-85]